VIDCVLDHAGVAMTSVSEAFPYAIVEAMLTEAAIVATDRAAVRRGLPLELWRLATSGARRRTLAIA